MKIARNILDLMSAKRANAAFYHYVGKLTALHDVMMNAVWWSNFELGRKCKDHSFEYNGET